MVFSEYELKQMGVKVAGSEDYIAADCVGSCEEEMEVKVVNKSCRGVVVKTRVRGTGKGKLNISMHCPKEIYDAAYGMELDTLLAGVKAYGQNSVHKTFSIVQLVEDEDGNVKYKAYPNCIIESGKKGTIENGAEEVAEIEMEVSVMPDDFGNGVYEALALELDDEVKEQWMNAFTPSLVQAQTDGPA